MHELVGQTLALDEGQFEIVDVRQVGGELMVYAEAEEGPSSDAGLTRTVFRYPDIASYVEHEQ